MLVNWAADSRPHTYDVHKQFSAAAERHTAARVTGCTGQTTEAACVMFSVGGTCAFNDINDPRAAATALVCSFTFSPD